MWSTIATFKENLSQIALDVQDAAEELEIYRSSSTEDASVADRRISHRFAQSQSPQASALSNGIDSAFRAEIERYKAEIRRLLESEAEIKALSVNYAALLKEKEQELSRLNEENGSLRKNSVIANAVSHASRRESFKTTNNTSMPKGTGDKSPSRQQRGNSRHIGNHVHKGVFPKQDLLSNGNADASPSDGNQQKMETKLTNSRVSGEEPADILEEHKSLAAMQAGYEAEIQQLKSELQKERDNLASMILKLQGESKLNESSQKELLILKMDKEKISMEMKELHGQLRDKVSEIKRLQFELNQRKVDEDSKELSGNLKDAIAALEEENANLKREKGKLEAALDLSMNKKQDRVHGNDLDSSNLDSHEELAAENFPEKKDMSTSIESLTEDFKVACRERDKALQELARLKQHLLDKELEESDKMDEDSKTIEDLRAHCEHQMAQILHLEKSLKQAISSHEETKRASSDELRNLNEIINDLKKKLSSCTSIIDSKNTELLNLQTALGQYYAETEAKERLERDLAVTREELAKLSEQLKDVNQRMEFAKQEKEEFLAKLSYAEKLLLEGKHAAKKLEEDNLKLRRALEQSMTRLNRMSVESDYLVDRRIVIKLLVTYFQRNHSKEVLDLMVRMLGFSEEDKQRVGFAQQVAGKGIVRGVLGLPGRLVGGMLGSGSPYVSAGHMSSENQSFADLWVDFLLKETEEREKKETAEVGGASRRAPEGTPNSASTPSISEERTISSSFSSNYQSMITSASEIPAPQSMGGGSRLSEQFDREFSSVPLTSAASSTLAESSSSSSSRGSRLFPRS